MSVADALRKLQAAGKVRAAWLPGMRAVGAIPRYPIRLTDGERAFDVTDPVDSWQWWQQPEDRDGGPYPGPYEPDLMDPATSGCLLALLREASGEPRLLPTCTDEDGIPCWVVAAGTYETTEGEAIAAALVALAEGLP